jgi:putative transposase
MTLRQRKIQHSLMSFTAHQCKADLELNHPHVLSHFKVKATDRNFKFWQRNSLGVDLFNEAVFVQKLDYIHWNPVKAGLCNLPEQYYYTSAKFYEYGVDDFGMLTHYKG